MLALNIIWTKEGFFGDFLRFFEIFHSFVHDILKLIELDFSILSRSFEIVEALTVSLTISLIFLGDSHEDTWTFSSHYKHQIAVIVGKLL